jgi:hypothetical protein
MARQKMGKKHKKGETHHKKNFKAKYLKSNFYEIFIDFG